MLILYITYIDFGEASSGSGVRPQRMYRAMLEEGHQVKLLCGNQGSVKNHKARAAAVEEISRWLDSNRPDICYVESPVYPILWKFDRDLIRKIHRMGIPMGYFYRDFYRKFPKQFPHRPGLANAVRDTVLDVLQRMTDKTLENVDIVYFPAKESFQLFDYRDMRPLPPGGENWLDRSMPEERRCIYVGGVLKQYAGEMLLEAFALLNSGEERYPLTLVCREKEWARIPDKLKGADWLELHHASGEELVPLLSRAAAGLLIGKRDETYSYFEYGYSIKLFEYLGYGLPVVYVHNTPMDRFVTENGMGIGVECDPESFARGVRALFEEPEKYAQYRANACRALVSGNTWNHRVRQLVRELSALDGRK
jgi:glycosyltransferase involved in cell wall biosynthesis